MNRRLIRRPVRKPTETVVGPETKPPVDAPPLERLVPKTSQRDLISSRIEPVGSRKRDKRDDFADSYRKLYRDKTTPEEPSAFRERSVYEGRDDEEDL